MKRQYKSLATGEDELTFGRASFPVRRRGVDIGNGRVVPEIKFTLPATDLDSVSREEIRREYAEMVDGVCERAVALMQPEIIVEFEHLPPMTEDPEWGADLTALLRDRLDVFNSRHQLRSLLRVTPVDIREMDKPPLRRSGQSVPILFDSFSRCARSGADLLSIESTGGKEVTDHAIMAGDIQGVFYGLGVLGVADMRFLWAEICRISEAAKAIPAGDTACGFGNTAMMLADQRFIPKVFAAVVRAMSAVRSLVAYEEGAQGPGKDCGYENIYLKAITGLPMSLEGRSAAGAHMSSIGNIAGAYADAWSNESIPNIKLLSGMAPVVSMEQLVYDCRLYNVATQRGDALRFRDMMIESDAPLDPQAYLFRPELVVNLCREVIAHTDPLKRMAAAGLTAINQLRTGYAGRAVRIPPKEIPWLDRMHDGLTSALQDGEAFMHRQKEEWREYVAFGEYGLSD